MTRAERQVLGVAGAVLLASLAFTVHPWYEPRPDAALYIATARSLASGNGYSYLGMPFVLRPPGFPLLIAPVIRLAGVNFYLFNLLVSAFGVAGVVALYAWLRPRAGWILALAGALCVWLNPGYQRLCNTVLSDIPGAALVLWCLLLDRWGRQRPSWWREALLGLAVGLAGYVRTAGLLLVPAIAIARIVSSVENQGRISSVVSAAARAGLFAAVAALVALPWFVYSVRAAPARAVDQTRIYSYTTAILRQDPGDPASRPLDAVEILSRISVHARRIAEVVGDRMRLASRDPKDGAPIYGVTRMSSGGCATWFFAFLLLGALIVQTVKRRGAAEFFAVGSLLLLLVYLRVVGRVLLPVYLVALCALIQVVRDFTVRLLGVRAGIAVAVAVVAGLALFDFAPRAGWDQRESRHHELVAFFSEIEAQLPPGARVGAVVAFQYNVFLDQPVYSLFRSVNRRGVARGVEEIIVRYDLDTIVVGPEKSRLHRNIESYVRERYGDPERVGSARIWYLADR